MVKNLITGGLGFFGLCLARQLLRNKEEVVLFQRRTTVPRYAEDIKGKVKIVSGDISNWAQVVDAVKSNDIDCIWHLAALLSKHCEASAALGFQVNIVGTFNVLEAARILGVHDIIFASSSSIRGFAAPNERTLDSNAVYHPPNLYNTTKICCERLGEYYHRRYSVDFRGIRFAMVIGLGRQTSYYYGDYSGAIEVPAQGKPYTVHVDESVPVALIYIKDAVRALVDLKKANGGKLRQQIYNVHGFKATTREIANTVKKYLPEAQIDFCKDKSEEMRLANIRLNYEMDNTPVYEDFGWQPSYLLDKAVEDFIKEVKNWESMKV